MEKVREMKREALKNMRIRECGDSDDWRLRAERGRVKGLQEDKEPFL